MGRAPYRAERMCDERGKKKPSSYSLLNHCRNINGCVKVNRDEISEELWQQTWIRAWPDAPCVKWRRYVWWAKAEMHMKSHSGLKGQNCYKTCRVEKGSRERKLVLMNDWAEIRLAHVLPSLQILVLSSCPFTPFFWFIYKITGNCCERKNPTFITQMTYKKTKAQIFSNNACQYYF